MEDAAAKEDVFRRCRRVLPPEAILASNTSSIPITSLAAATSRPERVIGMHFFNPVPVLKLVEVIRGLQTSDETAAAIATLARELGKVPAEANDFPGFVSNRILMPFINEAAYALIEGVAEAEAIDTIAKLGFAHPMGPLALADLIGLDTCVAIMDVLHEGSATRSTRRARCCGSTSQPGGSAARAVAASTTTDDRRVDPRVHAHLESTPSDQEFVDAAFRLVLRREPDAEARSRALAKLAEGTLSRASLLRELVVGSGIRARPSSSTK